MYVEDIIRRTLENDQHGITVGRRKANNLRHADDITLLTTTDESVDERVVKLVNDSNASNMILNAKKSKIMVAGRQNVRIRLHIDGEQIEQVSGNCNREIKNVSVQKQRK